MKKCFLQFVLSITFISGITQEKVAGIDPGKSFFSRGYSIGYYNKCENNFRITLQNATDFTRLLYDSNFSLTDSFSFTTTDLSLSKSTGVTTPFDKLPGDTNIENISGSNSFLIIKNDTYYLGYYSKDSKKTEVYKYDGD